MCGIIGILLHTNINHNIYKELFDGLKQLLNRGYDSAGVCAIENDTFQVHKFASTNDKSAMDKLIEFTFDFFGHVIPGLIIFIALSLLFLDVSSFEEILCQEQFREV